MKCCTSAGLKTGNLEGWYMRAQMIWNEGGGGGEK